MAVVPQKKTERVDWCETRVAPWSANAVAIGTSVAEVAAWEAKVEAARAALAAMESARAASKAATETFNNAIAAMDIATQGIIKQVRAKAETTHNPAVYTMALVPAPAVPTSVGDPGTASSFKAELLQDGPLDLRWKCKNPPRCTGVVYQVWRRIGGSGDFTYVGGSGEKRFHDATIPAGSSFITYKIQAVRSTAVGAWATFNVFFGTDAGGTLKATVTDATPRMAA